MGVANWMLCRQRGVDSSDAESEKMNSFVRAVFAGYLALPYHNVRHGVDVLHTVWRLGRLMPWNVAFSDNQQFALLIAALAHDIGHFGLTNVFLVDMRDELAIRYNDLSPLENMHCNKLFHVLVSDKTNVLSHLSTEEFTSCRKLIIDAILNTDPAQHGAMVMDLKALGDGEWLSLRDAGSSGDELLTEIFSNADMKTLGARCILHAADLSNPSKPFNIAKGWAQNVLNEFFAQGDKEKELGVPIGMLNDRVKVNLPSSQLGFIQFMVAPFVSAYTKVLPTWFDFNTMLGSNLGEWAQLVLDETGKDESGRVEAVRGVLELARMPEVIKDTEAEPIEDTPTAAPAYDIDAIVPMPLASLKQELPEEVVVARELRRWREQQQDGLNTPETRQYRELLLIYMLSNGSVCPDVNKDVVLKFSTSQGHFSKPEAARPREFTQASDSVNEPRVVSVAEAVDNVQSQLNQDEFDRLLTSLLNDQDSSLLRQS